ncbi:MAG: carboxypeptidase-like regulatory domain-containing protein [Saprospiraceae bacterium]|nr:carboxypeptidase-like regulatory domain-containing protein [Saprospiraceae bacterium]
MNSFNIIHIVLLLLLFCLNIANSQRVVYATVLDSKSNKPLEFVIVRNKANNQIVETNKNGAFSMPINSFKDTLEVTYLGYNRLSLISGDIKETIFLKQNINLLDEVEISSSNTSKQLSTKDLTPISIVSDDTFLYVLYTKNKGRNEKYSLHIFNEYGVIKDIVEIEEKEKFELIKNCRGDLYLKLGDEFILIDIIDDTFQMIEKINAVDFYKLFGKCIGNFKSTYMYELVKMNGLHKLYFVVNADSFHIAKSIVFDKKIKNYIYDKGFIEYGKNVSTMEITDYASNLQIRRDQASSFILENIIHKNRVNNFCFVYDNNFVLFNFDEAKMEWFDNEGKAKKTIESVDFLASDQYKNFVLQDKLGGKFYVVKNLRDDYQICMIDMNTGIVNDFLSLNIAFFESIEIINGNVFILGRKNNIEFNKLYYKSNN